MNRKGSPRCEFLVDNSLCSAVAGEEAKSVREESCTNDLKNCCCYLCNERNSCEISCRYLDKVAEPLAEKTEQVVPDFQVCNGCGTSNKVGSKFCKKCGASMQLMDSCPQCRSKLELDAVFCQECGTKLPHRSQSSIQEPI